MEHHAAMPHSGGGAAGREPEQHLVQFYETDAYLADEVASFLAAGLQAEAAAVIIATRAHRDAIEQRLRTRGLELARLVEQHRAVVLDAEETLAMFMAGGAPRWDRFLRTIGGVLDRLVAARPGTRVRAYGEMVDVLWRAGQQDAAICLEEMWNDLRGRYELTLLCAYGVEAFHKEGGIPRICATHSHVLPSERPARPDEPEPIADTVRSLISEIARRTELERALRESLRRAYRAEAEARESRDDLEDFLANAVVPIHRVDREGIIRWANAAELELFGYARDEYVGHHIVRFHANARLLEDILVRLARDETLRDYEVPMRTKSGEIRIVQISSNVQRKGGAFHTTRCFTRDVTEAKRAERRSQVLHQLVSALSSALSAEEASRVVSQEARGVIGAPMGAVLLLDLTRTQVEHVFLDGDPGAPSAAGISNLSLEADLPICEAARTGEPVWIVGQDAIEARYPHLTALRQDVHALTWGAVPITFEGKTLGSIGFRCVEERALTGDEQALLLAIGRHCGQAIERARLHDAAEAARAEAEQASRAKDEFLAILGHELRNPLASILTAVQLLRLRGEVSSRREQHVIERQVDHLIHIVDDLLDISRVARGKIELDRRPLALQALVGKAIEITGPSFAERQQRLDALLPAEEIWLDADETRLCQVITNLLSNAAKYTPPHGHVTIRAAREGARAVIRVEDDGQGIAPDLLPRIFDLFVQGDRTLDRRQGGLGIGLALVRNLVRMHGGTVHAHSEGPGRGSEFVVELPVIERARVPQLPSDRGWDLGGLTASRRVLIVDDNEDAGQLLGEMLGSIGHEVRVAADGPRALELVETFTPDVAILDIGLPVMDGYALAAALRDRLGTRVRLLAVTGYGREQDRRRVMQSGFDSHFVKPVPLQTVLAAIEGGAGTGARRSATPS